MKVIRSDDFRAWLKGYKQAYGNREKEKSLIKHIEDKLLDFEIEVKDVFIRRKDE